ncbi:uracil-DNA glycosylase [Natronobeatus ordinarius]|uniref:uracil-DNA glycosylase n=1 Tax=Natronobeatus ordinarius TaxID=2963433 RepID=UPI0020CCC521|nr:uracil-DNA glycosylase [Natronobeatus ordinarius]
MDANQHSRENPFGMDEACRNCPALCEPRTQVVHGYGDVGADFLFVGERPGPGADAAGVPFAGDDGAPFRRLLERLGLCRVDSDPDWPELVNVYLTNLTRCRDPDRRPTDDEIENCEPFLNAEIRMINPEIIVPIGERALHEIGEEYTTAPVDDLDVVAQHGTAIRGRGFELVPMIDPHEQSDEQIQSWLESFAALMASDYRQTKGRQER